MSTKILLLFLLPVFAACGWLGGLFPSDKADKENIEAVKKEVEATIAHADSTKLEIDSLVGTAMGQIQVARIDAEFQRRQINAIEKKNDSAPYR